jgi:hypothetical protein
MLESLSALKREGRALLLCLARDVRDAGQGSAILSVARRATDAMAQSFWSRAGRGYEQERPLFGPLVLYRRTEDQAWSPHYMERREEHGLRLKALKRPDRSGCGDIGIALVRKIDHFRSGLGAEAAVHLYPVTVVCAECRRTGGAHSDACVAKPGNQ